MADVWITWCKKRCRCYYCQEDIISGTPMVKVKIWRPGKWTFYQRHHPQCYLDQGIRRLERDGFPSRKRLLLSDEDSVIRNKILRRASKCRHSLRQAVKREDVIAVNRLLDQFNALKVEIEPVGGVPKSWLG